jgi:hypothetical protein
MANFRASLVLIFGLVSLIISFGVVSQGGPVEVEELPSPTPSATPLPKPEPFPGAARLVRCQTMSQPRFFFYVPTAKTGEDLTISGTVYASDLTPLPGALVEIWQGDVSQVNHPYPPIFFGGRLRTDEAGHYELRTTKFTLSGTPYLHYRVTYQDYCLLEMYLHLLVEPPTKPDKHIVAYVQITGPVLQGPVDIVLPVPSAKP